MLFLRKRYASPGGNDLSRLQAVGTIDDDCRRHLDEISSSPFHRVTMRKVGNSPMADNSAEIVTLTKEIGTLRGKMVKAQERLDQIVGVPNKKGTTVDGLTPEELEAELEGTVMLEDTAPARPRSTVFSYLSVEILPDEKLKRGLILVVEALAYVGLSMIISRIFGVAESGMFSILLASAVLSARMLQLLEENRKRIWEIGYKSWKTNTLTAFSIFAIFLGTILAYVIAAIWMDDKDVASSFHFALKAAGLGTDSILTRNFSGLGPVVFHNSIVLVSVSLMSFVYRAFGALLAIVWNACIWGLVLTFLVKRGLTITEGSAVGFIAISSIAVLPHLILEAAAYVAAAMASIFLSKALMKYSFGTPEFRAVFLSCLRLFAISAVLLFAAALFETQLAPWLLGTLK